MTQDQLVTSLFSELFHRMDSQHQEIRERLDELGKQVQGHGQDIAVLQAATHLPESCENVAVLESRVTALEVQQLSQEQVFSRLWKVAAAAAAAIVALVEVTLAWFRR